MKTCEGLEIKKTKQWRIRIPRNSRLHSHISVISAVKVSQKNAAWLHTCLVIRKKHLLNVMNVAKHMQLKIICVSTSEDIPVLDLSSADTASKGFTEAATGLSMKKYIWTKGSTCVIYVERLSTKIMACTATRRDITTKSSPLPHMWQSFQEWKIFKLPFHLQTS